MSNNERISALMDHQLSEQEWLQAVAEHPDQSETWARYHLIGDALRDELPVRLDLDLDARIAKALADEPTVLAPKPRRLSLSSTAVSLLQHAGQYAIAASVAAMTVLGIQHYSTSSSTQNVNAPVPVLNTIPVGGMAAPVSVTYGPEGDVVRTHSAQPSMSEAQLLEQRQRINAFLRDHQLQQRLH